MSDFSYFSPFLEQLETLRINYGNFLLSHDFDFDVSDEWEDLQTMSYDRLMHMAFVFANKYIDIDIIKDL